MESNLDILQAHLGYTFGDVALLRLALTHPSVAHEQGATIQHNQRLEFLGDAVLQLVLTRVLYEKFPSYGEGPLTKARAHLVNSRALAEHGRRLRLGEFLTVSRGEDQNNGRERPAALADAFEAVLGAIFLDRGFDAAREFIDRQYRDVFTEIAEIPIFENPKGELQEVLQAKSPEPPQYRLVSVSGPDHDRVFECLVSYRGEELGRGSGKSKKEAESNAALKALQTLRLKSDPPPADSAPPTAV